MNTLDPEKIAMPAEKKKIAYRDEKGNYREKYVEPITAELAHNLKTCLVNPQTKSERITSKSPSYIIKSSG